LRYDSSISESGGGFGRGGRLFERAPRVLKKGGFSMILVGKAIEMEAVRKEWAKRNMARGRAYLLYGDMRLP
jgi:hypothetical protein